MLADPKDWHIPMGRADSWQPAQESVRVNAICDRQNADGGRCLKNAEYQRGTSLYIELDAIRLPVGVGVLCGKCFAELRPWVVEAEQHSLFEDVITKLRAL